MSLTLAISLSASLSLGSIDFNHDWDTTGCGGVPIFDVGCPPGLVSVNGDCLMPTPPPFPLPPLPPGWGGGHWGGGGSTPPLRPTLSECTSANTACLSNADSAQTDCVWKQENLASATSASQSTCHGNALEVMTGLTVTMGSGKAATTYACTLGDLNKTTLPAYACRYLFRARSYLQCLQGAPSATTVGAGEVRTTIGIDEFLALGISVPTDVRTFRPAGGGALETCGAIRTEAANLCSKALAFCNAKAAGASPPHFVTPSAANLLPQIDRAKLGLPVGNQPVALVGGFIDTPKRTAELESLYLARLQFLASWSWFLDREGTSATVQRSAQSSFESAQRAFGALVREQAARSTLAHVRDPFDTQAEFEADVTAYRQFVDSNQYRQRTLAIEAALMQSLATHLGASARDRFKASVWPGITTFGFAEPMRPLPVSTLSP